MNEKTKKSASLVGKLVEIDGQVTGIVVDENEKTLLIRKGFVTSLDGETDTFVAGPHAVFIDKKLIYKAYWLRFLSMSKSAESVDMAHSIELVRELLDM